jgi:hypothetical protein
LAQEKEAKGIDNKNDLRRGDLVSERKRISGLLSLISILIERIATGPERPLQFQEIIFMGTRGTNHCPLTW